MADNLENTEGGSEELSREERLDALAEKFEKEDREAAEREDAADDEEEGEERKEDDDDLDDEDDRTDEHADRDTGSHRDDDDDESLEDSPDDDLEDTDIEDDDESNPDDESDENPDAEPDDDEENNEDEDDTSGETKAALAKHGADLTLDDVPEKYRPLIKQKLDRIDRAFTKAQQEATAFRTKEREFRAEETYRAENPELVVTDMLRKGGPDLFAKVNKLLNRIDPDGEGNTKESIEDAEAVLDERIEGRKKKAIEAIDAKEREEQELLSRASTIEKYAETFAKKLGVPFTDTIDELLEAAIMRKAPKDRGNGLSEKEIEEVITRFARNHKNSVRAHRREASKKVVQQQTSERRGPKRTVRQPSGTSSAGGRRPAKEKVDHNDPESRLKAMMRTAKRVMPGAK